MEVFKLTLRHTPGMGPGPQLGSQGSQECHGPRQQSAPPVEATPLSHSVNGSLRRPAGQEKYRPKPLSSRAIHSQAQIFRKRMCDDIRPPTPSQMKALEVRRMDGRVDGWKGGWCVGWWVDGWVISK